MLAQTTTLVQYACKELPGLDIVIDQADGSIWASQRAVARFIDKDDSYVRRYLRASFGVASKSPLRNATILTPPGLRSATILPLSVIMDIVFQYNPRLYKRAAEAGFRVYFYQLAGYEVKVEDTKPQPQQKLNMKELAIAYLALVNEDERVEANLSKMPGLKKAYEAAKQEQPEFDDFSASELYDEFKTTKSTNKVKCTKRQFTMALAASFKSDFLDQPEKWPNLKDKVFEVNRYPGCYRLKAIELLQSDAFNQI